VPTGERDLEAATGLQLSTNLGEIRHRRSVARVRIAHAAIRRIRPRRRRRGRELDPGWRRKRPAAGSGANRIGRLAQRRDAHHIDAARQARLLDGVNRDDDPFHPAPAERRGQRQDPGHRPDLAAQRQLPDHGQPPARGAHLLRPEQDSHRNRQIERCAGLPEVRGRQVHRDPARRMNEPRVADRATHPLASLLERRIRQAHDREARQARCDVDLHPDDPAVEADEGGREQGREHDLTLSAGDHLGLTCVFATPSPPLDAVSRAAMRHGHQADGRAFDSLGIHVGQVQDGVQPMLDERRSRST